jgi:hypothetical protein
MFLHGRVPRTINLNDPPLAEAISAIPLLFAAEIPRYTQVSEDYILANIKDRTLSAIGLMKSILLLPLIFASFVWALHRWGLNAAWLCVALILVEPTIAAHTPLPTTDVLGMEAVALTCMLAWASFENPSLFGALSVAAAVGISLMVKHTTVILPVIVLLMAVAWWVVLRILRRQSWANWRDLLPGRLVWLGTVGVVTPIALWAATGFDYSQPFCPGVLVNVVPHWVLTLCTYHCPGGIYISSFLDAYAHSRAGHPAILFGTISQFGWWYYFPAIATIKVPFGIWALFILAVVSCFIVRPRWSEMGAVLCFVCYSIFLMHSPIDIGFRHALPAYIFALLLCVRAAGVNRIMAALAWICVAATLVDTSTFHPNYLAYTNRPISHPWMQMGDSNIDWARMGKQVCQWVHDRVHKDGVVVTYINNGAYIKPEWQRGIILTTPDRLPTRGLLIISPDCLNGRFDPEHHLQRFQNFEPIAIIAHSVPVFDLDLLPAAPPPAQHINEHVIRDKIDKFFNLMIKNVFYGGDKSEAATRVEQKVRQVPAPPLK